MKILLTNDDGIYAPGLRAMARALRALGEVVVVAPASEESGVGHGLTIHHPLMALEIRESDFHGFAVEGKPADCVKLGLVELLDSPPDLVVSGINAGANAGINVLYSGTVAAAIEGAFFEVTSIAVSLELPEPGHFARAAEIALSVIRRILQGAPAKGELFNVNIPELSKGDPEGVVVAPQALICYRERYEARKDPRGRSYYWLLPEPLTPEGPAETDVACLASRRITVTPLHFDLTAHQRLQRMQQWDWDPF